MKIVILDGHAANPGDLSWEELATCAELKVYPRTAAQEIIERAGDAEILLTNKVFLLRPELEQLPALRCIGVLATGFNVVDIEVCRQRQVAVTNIPGYSSASVCQMTFALMLNLAQQVGHHAELVRTRAWSRSNEPCFIDRPLLELAGLTLGLVGFGQIARAVARVAQAFGMQVQVMTAHPENYREAWPQLAFVSKQQLMKEADLISLHCPLNEQTRQLIEARFLAGMKPGALLINTARGLLVDENAVGAALKSGQLGGYAADVMGTEPPPADHPLLDAPNCLLTSHIAWGTTAARQRLVDTAIANVKSFLAGGRLNRIV